MSSKRIEIAPKENKGTVSANLIVIKNKLDLIEFNQIVKSLFKLYEDKDLEIEYKESSKEIKKRITEESDNPSTYLIAYTSNKISIVEGGCIVEFYKRSNVLLITYLFVKSSKRRKGIAKTLINDGISKIIANLSKQDCKVEYVFLEAKNPFKVNDPALQIEAAERLLIFKSLGAKWIDLEYLHPPILIDGQQLDVISDLWLLTIPSLTLKTFFLNTEVLNIFLLEYYYSLGALSIGIDELIKNVSIENKSIDSEDIKDALKQMLKDIENKKYYSSKNLYLKEIPKFERPRIKFNRTSICFEFLVDESQTHVRKIDFSGNLLEMHKHNPKNDYNYCNFFHSYETDLFSFHFQEDPPYYTKSWDSISATKIKIYIPTISEFISEGRKEMLYSFDEFENDKGYKIIPARAFVNYTYFRESKIRIWHLIISSDETYTFTELDIIKLLKIFNGSQERDIGERRDKNKYINGIKFKINNDNKYYTISNLIFGLTGISYINKNLVKVEKLDFPTTGIIEIDTENCSFIDYTSEPASESTSFDELYTLIANANKLDDRIDYHNISMQSKSDFFEYLCGALCGISLGILDYKRMGYEEVMDTLIPRSETESSFISLNRGLLCLIGSGDSVLESCWNTLGMSPYLIIPSAVLAHNQYLVDEAEIEVNKVNEKMKNLSNSGVLLSAMIKEAYNSYNKVNELVNILSLKNIFQYPTEKDLYEYGSEHRRIFEKVKIVEQKMEQLKNYIYNLEKDKDAAVDKKNKEILVTQYLVSAFLGIISAAGFHSLFNDSLNDRNKVWLPFIDASAFFTVAIILSIFFYRIKSNLGKI